MVLEDIQVLQIDVKCIDGVCKVSKAELGVGETMTGIGGAEEGEERDKV